MRVVLVLLFASFFLFSCGKKRSIHITATNAATGERYAGLEYSVVSTLISATNGKSTKTEASGVLSSSGEAIIQLRQQRGRTYAVRVVEPENCCYNKQSTMFFDSPYDKNGHFDFEFAECAYLKQHIVNVNCEGITDVCNMRDRFTYTDWTGWSIDLSGCYSNTGGDYSRVPAGKRYFEWKVTRPSGITYGIDSIQLEPGEYGTITINY